jgi:hypothetical protein
MKNLKGHLKEEEIKIIKQLLEDEIENVIDHIYVEGNSKRLHTLHRIRKAVVERLHEERTKPTVGKLYEVWEDGGYEDRVVMYCVRETKSFSFRRNSGYSRYYEYFREIDCNTIEKM